MATGFSYPPNQPRPVGPSGHGHPMQSVCDQWLVKIQDALKRKEEKFGRYAREAALFYDGAHDFMWRSEYARTSGGFLSEDSGNVFPMFRMQVNRLFEAVALFGPALYHQNPTVVATPRLPPEIAPAALGLDESDPMQAEGYRQVVERMRNRHEIRATHASIFETYLNWLQAETNKKDAARSAITEALVHGLGFLWVEMFQPPGSPSRYPRAHYVAEEDVVWDADANYWEDVQWLARRRREPKNKVAEKFGIPDEWLMGHHASMEAQANRHGSPYETAVRSRDPSQTYDIVEYWEVFSKNGFGDYLERTSGNAEVPHSRFDWRFLGRYTYAAVAHGVPYPLNIPSDVLATEEPEQLIERAQWPWPAWADPDCGGGWPCSRLTFYHKPRSTYPISMFKACIGELRFINWIMSFLADKAATACQTYVAVIKEAATELQQHIQKQKMWHGLAPYRLMPISGVTGLKLNEIIQFMQAPPFTGDIWRMAAEVMELIDKRTGLTELVYGMTGRQMRSASEANIRDERVSIRPDDMAGRVEDWLSEIAQKEMQCLRWAGAAEDLEPVCGDVAATVWEQQVLPEDYLDIVRSYDFRIEAGSARKPNKQTLVSSLTNVAQIIQPTAQELLMAGMPAQWNALVSALIRANGLDPTPFLVELPEPREQGPSPEEQEAERDLERDEEKHDQELRHADEKHDQELEQAGEMGRLQVSLARSRASAPRNNGNGRN